MTATPAGELDELVSYHKTARWAAIARLWRPLVDHPKANVWARLPTKLGEGAGEAEAGASVLDRNSMMARIDLRFWAKGYADPDFLDSASKGRPLLISRG